MAHSIFDMLHEASVALINNNLNNIRRVCTARNIEEGRATQALTDLVGLSRSHGLSPREHGAGCATEDSRELASALVFCDYVLW
jgi:hypothetical protein